MTDSRFVWSSFSPTDSKFATCSDDGTVRIWDFLRCHEERILRGTRHRPSHRSPGAELPGRSILSESDLPLLKMPPCTMLLCSRVITKKKNVWMSMM